MSFESVTNAFQLHTEELLSATTQFPIDFDAKGLIQLELIKMHQYQLTQLNKLQEIAVVYNPTMDVPQGFDFVVFDRYGKYFVICRTPSEFDRFQQHVYTCVDEDLTYLTGELQVLSEYVIIETFIKELEEYFTFAYYEYNRYDEIVSFDFEARRVMEVE